MSHALRYEQIARECVRKKDERGEQIVISLDGRKRDRVLSDDDFVGIAQHIPDVVRDMTAGGGVRPNRLVQIDFHGENNKCGDEGAAAICRALIQLRTANIAAVRAVFLWKNMLGDRGAMAVAELVNISAVQGHDRHWIAEVLVSSSEVECMRSKVVQ
jgi:hypothetical protein